MKEEFNFIDKFKELGKTEHDKNNLNEVSFAAKYLSDIQNSDQVRILNKIKEKILQRRPKLPWNKRLRQSRGNI